MRKKNNNIIVENDNIIRIDQYLAEKEGKYTRTLIQKMLTEGKILVNGKEKKASYKVKSGDIIEVEELDTRTLEVVPEDIDVDIVYEDDDIIIVNKKKGMVVHPANGNYTGTLVNALMHSHKDRLSSINGVIRPGIVHRLDKDTSGLLVVAKNDIAHKILSENFKKHEVKRSYICLVKGIVAKDELVIKLPIGRDDANRKKMKVTKKNSREAETHIKVLERFKKSGYTLVRATLKTGRTHQIRVHMSHINHSIVGDGVYGKEKNEFNMKGQMLHADNLAFSHPVTKEHEEWRIKLPKEFEVVLELLRKREK